MTPPFSGFVDSITPLFRMYTFVCSNNVLPYSIYLDRLPMQCVQMNHSCCYKQFRQMDKLKITEVIGKIIWKKFKLVTSLFRYTKFLFSGYKGVFSDIYYLFQVHFNFFHVLDVFLDLKKLLLDNCWTYSLHILQLQAE